MVLNEEKFTIEPIALKDAWRICDFMVANADRLKRYFPLTLEQNLNPTLSAIFVEKKVVEFSKKLEYLFTLKSKEDRTIIGLIYIKELDWEIKQGELAYCIGYQYEGKGWMSTAISSITKHAFSKLELTSLQIIVHKSNYGSIHVAKNNGYIWTKTLLQEHTPPGENALDMELYELKK